MFARRSRLICAARRCAVAFGSDVACKSPIEGWRLASGSVVFGGGKVAGGASILLPCGRCIGCRLERSRQWAVRMVHEASLHQDNCAALLTYKDLPEGGSLRYVDVQLFLKRLRRALAPRRIKFFCAGEYGSLGRPHYHLCIFGFRPADGTHVRSSDAGSDIFHSPDFQRHWPLGEVTYGELNFESAAYAARYCLQKVTGDDAERHYAGREPEFARMSLRPGIGRQWFERFSGDVYPADGVLSRGRLSKPPRAYDKWLKKLDRSEFEELKIRREHDAYPRRSESSVDRLAVRAEVEKARLQFFKRSVS